MWTVVLTKQANKDAKKLAASGLKSQTQALLANLAENPFQPPSEKLKGDLSGYYSLPSERLDVAAQSAATLILGF